MLLEIISPEKKVFSGQASAVQLPGTGGLFQLLDNHAAMISTLVEGEVKIVVEKADHFPDEAKVRKEGKNVFFPIKGGVVEVKKNKVIVLAD